MKLTSRLIGGRRSWTLAIGRMRFTVRRVARVRPYFERDSQAWWPFWGAAGICGVMVVISTWSR